ncbi:LysE family translocator [Aliiruegeria haliotis]|nr:LysE family translocator [Aliiruegeria haliotis]
MTPDLLTALAAFCFVSSITPGPNNLMLMTSGANFGLRRTLPHLLGISIGFTVMVVLVGTGLARVFDLIPAARDVLRGVSVIYLLWLAWEIATAMPPGQGAHEGRPLTFLQAAVFQWVNPKAWTMALTAVTVYTPGHSFAAVLLTAAIFGAINLPSCSGWIVLGQQVARLLTSHARLRVFNGLMASLLVASLWPVLA